MPPKLLQMGGPIRITRPLILGLILVVFGLVFLALGLSSQLDIDSIGATNDPALLERVSQLEDERNLFVITASGAIFLGLFSALILSEKKMAFVIPADQMMSAAKVSRDILSGLSLAGSASYLPARHGLTREKLFVPATNSSSTHPPVLSDDLTLSPGKDGSAPGLLVEPVGMRLLNSIESELDVKVADTGMESVEGSLQTLKHGLSIMRDFHFKVRNGKTILRVEYSAFSDQCRSIRKELPDTCRQMACVGCSCLLTALARGTEKIVRVDEVDNKEDQVVFTLSLLDW